MYNCTSCGDKGVSKDKVNQFYSEELKTCRCNTCNTNMNKNRYHTKKALLNPENYLVCNKCPAVFNRVKLKKSSKRENDVLHIDCPRCGSEEIDRY